MTAGGRLALAALAVHLAIACTDSTAPSPPDREGGTWATWVIGTGSAVRPPAPMTATTIDLETVLTAQAALDPAGRAAIVRWDGAPSVAWNQVLEDRLSFYWALLPDVRTATPVRAGRALALLNVAIYDALVAVWDAKYAYNLKAPADENASVLRLVETGNRPGFPSEQSAAAAAAAEILAYVLPDDDRAEFDAMAAAAAHSRIAAGAAYQRDVDAGWAIGKEVARQVLVRARTDGSDAVWSGAPPIGDQYWVATPPRRTYPPFDALAGQWRPWVLPTGAQFRPPPHPALGSAAFLADQDELRTLSTNRTSVQADAARFWATDPPSNRWIDFAIGEIDTRHLSALRAARALTLTSIAMADAFVACWDGKFHYWLVRPITLDPSLATVFATPPFPSYPSGHSTVSAAAAAVLGYLFADRASHYRERADEASLSRVWGGVHYRFDITAGETMGSDVGQAVVARARLDGADQR